MKVDTQSREDLVFLENFARKDTNSQRFVLELSLSNDDNGANDTEESKLYCGSGLSKHSKVAILRAFMLHKQMNWLRNVMSGTFEEGIKNWRLPLNHCIPV